MPKFEQTCFSLDGRRFSVIWFSESIRNWRVNVRVSDPRWIRLGSDIWFSLRKCWYKSGCEVWNNSVIWSDSRASFIRICYLVFLYTTLLTQRLSNPMWEIPRFLTKFSSVARDSTKLRRSSGNARNVPLKSGMRSLSCIYVIHVQARLAVPHCVQVKYWNERYLSTAFPQLPGLSSLFYYW